MSFHLQPQTIKEIEQHALETYPEECCGIILEDPLGTISPQEYVRACGNIQNQRHTEDPKTYPRDARTAYLMDPDDLLRINLESERKNRHESFLWHLNATDLFHSLFTFFLFL